MRSLIVLAILGCAYAAPFLQDTPEVVAEKARFQQLYNAAAAAAAAAPDPIASAYRQAPVAAPRFNAPAVPQHHVGAPVFPHSLFNEPAVQQPAFKPQAAPAWKPTGPAKVYTAAEVNAARDAFLNAYKAEFSASTGHKFATPAQSIHTNNIFAVQQPAQVRFNAVAPVVQPRWTGPVAATIPAGLPGSVAQVGPTAEVAGATQAFIQAYNAAVTATTGRKF